MGSDRCPHGDTSTGNPALCDWFWIKDRLKNSIDIDPIGCSVPFLEGVELRRNVVILWLQGCESRMQYMATDFPTTFLPFGFCPPGQVAQTKSLQTSALPQFSNLNLLRSAL